MLQRKTEDGESVQVARLGPSEYFGKLAYCVLEISLMGVMPCHPQMVLNYRWTSAKRTTNKETFTNSSPFNP